MRSQHLGNLLHRFKAGAHGLAAPLVQELAGPSGRVIIPELLEVLFEEIGRYGRNFACSPRCSRQNDLDDGSLAIERINLVPLGGLWPKKGVAPGAAPQRIRLKRFRES